MKATEQLVLAINRRDTRGVLEGYQKLMLEYSSMLSDVLCPFKTVEVPAMILALRRMADGLECQIDGKDEGINVKGLVETLDEHITSIAIRMDREGET